MVRHSGTPACRVTVGRQEDELFLEISDEGPGLIGA